MEEIARVLAKKISMALSYDNEKESIIAYGMIAIVQIIFTIILIISLGLLLNILIEALIITFAVSILRRYSGGIHASTLELCMVIGVVYSIVFAWLSKYLFAPIMNLTIMLIIDIIVFGLSYLAIYKLAPVDTPNKPIITNKKKQRMRKGSYIVLTIYFIISILFVILNQTNIFWAGCFLSLNFGVIWQITTLTKFGTKIILKIDSALKNVKLFNIYK